MRNLSAHRLSLACITLFTLASLACGDDGKTDGATAADTGGTAEGADSTTAPETSGSSMEGDGDGDGDTGPGDGDGDTGPGDGDGDTGPGDGDGDTGPGDGDGDGDTAGSPCPAYETQDECDADPACMSLMGQPLQENGPDAPCLQPLEYAGCIPMMGCGDALTWFCTGGNAKPILMSSTCGPDGAQMCDPMIPDPPACP